ncbi:MAG: hypothetical protein ACPGJS_06875 [Flammeovirgaceae bacterium]
MNKIVTLCILLIICLFKVTAQTNKEIKIKPLVKVEQNTIFPGFKTKVKIALLNKNKDRQYRLFYSHLTKKEAKLDSGIYSFDISFGFKKTKEGNNYIDTHLPFWVQIKGDDIDTEVKFQKPIRIYLPVVRINHYDTIIAFKKIENRINIEYPINRDEFFKPEWIRTRLRGAKIIESDYTGVTFIPNQDADMLTFLASRGGNLIQKTFIKAVDLPKPKIVALIENSSLSNIQLIPTLPLIKLDYTILDGTISLLRGDRIILKSSLEKGLNKSLKPEDIIIISITGYEVKQNGSVIQFDEPISEVITIE